VCRWRATHEPQHDPAADVRRPYRVHAHRPADRLRTRWPVAAFHGHAVGAQRRHCDRAADLRHHEIGGVAGHPAVHPDGVHPAALGRDRGPLQGHGTVVRASARRPGNRHRDHLRDDGGHDRRGGRCRHRDGHSGAARDAAPRLQARAGTGHHLRIWYAGHPDSSLGADHRLRGDRADIHRPNADRRHRARHPAGEPVHRLHRRHGMAQARVGADRSLDAQRLLGRKTALAAHAGVPDFADRADPWLDLLRHRHTDRISRSGRGRRLAACAFQAQRQSRHAARGRRRDTQGKRHDFVDYPGRQSLCGDLHRAGRRRHAAAVHPGAGGEPLADFGGHDAAAHLPGHSARRVGHHPADSAGVPPHCPSAGF
jgi:hypothetical protein